MEHAANIAFVTLGCAKNEVDTDKMQARLRRAGFDVVDDCSAADLVVVNTCAFLEAAVEESLEVVFDIVRGDASPKVLVAGCMPARYGSDLADELTEVAGFLSVDDEENVVEAVEELLGVRAQRDPGRAHGAPMRDAVGPSAYVKISDGCDRFCSYCMIPHIRGRYRSFALEDVDAEVSELIAKGAREIVLIGQDTGIWGRDLDVPDTTAHLVRELAQRHPQTWFRLLYVQPEGLTDELLEAIASHENVCSYVDMPLQHASEAVLERMNRSGNPRDYLALVERIRKAVPDVMLRTTFMAGFPGETPEQFEELLDFVETASFDYAAVFPFSPEEGSAACEFDGQIDEEERMERSQRLLDASESVGTARMSALEGREVTVLVEGYERTGAGVEALCRTQGQAPEVDGQVHVPLTSEDELEIGQFARVVLTGSFFYELEGKLVRS